MKDAIKLTPLYAGSRRIYRKILEANLKKEDMPEKTRQMLKEKFQDNVSLLAQQTDIPVQEVLDRFSIRISLLSRIDPLPGSCTKNRLGNFIVLSAQGLLVRSGP